MEKREMTELYPMLSVEEALEQVLKGLHPLEPESVPLLEALGRVLAADVTADIDIPPRDNTAMDGYAVRAKDTADASPQAPKRLRIIGDLAAGYFTDQEVTPGTAIRIMTGAPIPSGADAVIRFEKTKRDGDWVELFATVPVGKNIRPAGEDVRQGEVVLRRGTRLRPQEIGMLASLGKQNVLVTRRPRVAILATGDELVDVGAPLGPGKIRDANSYSNAAQVVKYGGIPILLGIASDREKDVSEKIKAGLVQGVDLLLVSGGVSVGDFDVVKKVLAAEGRIDFWRVRMKPGKPLAFGHITVPSPGPYPEEESPRSVPVLGMPGNPVSVMVSFEMFARPAILTLLGVSSLEQPTAEATLVDPIGHKDDRRHFLRVVVEEREGECTAHLTGDQGSGILSSMVKADGLAIIPEDRAYVDAGARVRVILLR